MWALVLVLGAAPPMQRISFDDAIRQGLAHNVQAELAHKEIARAQGLLEEARAASLPLLTGNGSYTHLDHDRRIGTTLLAGENQVAGNVTLSVPLVAPPAWGRWSHSSTHRDTVASEELDVHRMVALAVARAYLAVITQTRLVEVQQHAVDTSRAHYDFAHTRYAGGVGNHLDELLADQELASSEAQLNTTFGALARSTEALGVVVGVDQPLGVDATLELPDVPPPGHDAADLGRDRADIHLAEARLAEAKQIERDNWLDFLPTLLGTIDPFYQRPPSSTVPHTGWQAQLILSVPLYDGGARYGQHIQHAAARAEAEVSLTYALRQARSEVRTAYETLHHAQDALDAAGRAALRAHDSVVLASDSYRAGTTNNLTVIDAERRSRDAETAAIVAEDAVRQARLDLLTASGRFP